MRLIRALALFACACMLLAVFLGIDPSGVAFAQPTDLPPGMTITMPGEPLIYAPAFLPAWLAPWWNWIATPAVLFWFMAQARAKFAILGRLGWLTTIGDYIAAANWGHARNAP